MSKFAKLFETEQCGQVLVMIRKGDEGPEVSVLCEPPGLGVSGITFTYSDDEEGWKSAEFNFSKIDEESALSLIRNSPLNSFFNGEISMTAKHNVTVKIK